MNRINGFAGAIAASLAAAIVFGALSGGSSAYGDATAVTTITSTSTTQTTATIDWTSTPGKYPIMDYIIQILPIGGPVLYVSSNTATTSTIAGLSPGETYELQFVTASSGPPPTGGPLEIQDLTLTTQGTSPTSVTATAPTPYLETAAPSINSLTATARTVSLAWVSARISHLQ
jgi:hypothetical protein